MVKSGHPAGLTTDVIRSADRFLLRSPLDGSFTDAGDIVVTDLSTDGAHVRLAAFVAPGSSGVLRIEDRTLVLTLEVRGTLLWVRRGDDDEWYGGLTWDTSPSVEGFLSQLCANRRADKVAELRSADRFNVKPPIPGVFTPIGEVQVIDISERGARILHPGMVRLHTRGLLHLGIPDAASFAFASLVVWSHLIKDAEGSGMTYHSGLTVARHEGELRPIIARLCEERRATIDVVSLAMKLKMFRSRALARARELQQVMRQDALPTEHFLLLEHVRQQLHANPDEAAQWYNRAKFSTVEESVKNALAHRHTNHEEILALWEYLERTVDLSIIERYFRHRA